MHAQTLNRTNESRPHLPSRATAGAPPITARSGPEALPATMGAIVRRRYGGPEVLELHTDRPVPSPGPDEVLVRVAASSVNFGDSAVLAGRPWLGRLAWGLVRPRNRGFGLDVAGEVAAVGERVDDLAIGERVFGETTAAHAEFVCVRRKRLARIPNGVASVQAGAVPVAGVTALQALRKLGVKPGQRVLINGASGGVGHIAVQLARAAGADVVAVCSGRNRGFVIGLGATEVVDYTTCDFTDAVEGVDGILDLVGSASIGRCLNLLRPGGRYLASAGRVGRVLGAFARSVVDRRVRVLASMCTTDDLRALGQHLATGEVRVSVERTVELADVAEAMRHQRTGRTRGKVSVVVASGPR